MNHLKVTLNPYTELNTASLNGYPLSPYSELSNYIKEPFLNWASKLFDAADREINDMFELTVISERLEQLFFESLCQNSSCSTVCSQKFEADFLVEKRFNVIQRLADKYEIPYNLEDFKIPAKINSNISVNNDLLALSTDAPFLLITKDYPTSVTTEPKIALVVAGENKITVANDGHYVWYVSEQSLNETVTAIINRFARIPFIVKTAEALLANKLLDSTDREIISLATSITPILLVENINNIEVGTTTAVKVKVVPENATVPTLRVETNDSHIIEINGLDIRGLSVGETEISIFKADEIIPFAKKKIKVYQDNSVKKIILNRTEPNMGIGRTQTIEISTVPEDAEDRQFVVWSVDNANIASVDEKGVVTAKGTGRVIVTASTPRVKESVIIDILPNINKITLSDRNLKVIKGESTTIDVGYSPSRCFNSDYHWTSNDNNIAYVETLPDGTSVVRTKDIGKCTLTCMADEGCCTETCEVEVCTEEQIQQEIKAENDKRLSKIDIACMIGIPVGIAMAIVVGAIIFFSTL